MEKENINWLGHLEEAVPETGYGNRLSSYLIALEAWRRGIKVKFFTIDNPDNKILVRYSLEFNDRSHRFKSSEGDLLTEEAHEICDNKHKTKEYLSNAGIKVPEGEIFNVNNNLEEMKDYAASLGFPVVVKPINENAGKGVFSNVDSEDNLIEIVNYLKEEMGYQELIIEEYIAGTEYRILTIDGKVSGAVNRVPANIVGDGKSTITQLIQHKNKSKRQNPNISKKTINVDNELLQNIGRSGYVLESIPAEGENVFLRTKSNISAGGDPIEITDKLPEEFRMMAEQAANAIPGLSLAGMDFIKDPETDEPTIIEINTKPMLGLHVYPVEGRPIDVVKPIVDMYFPETAEVEKSNLHFDFDAVLSLLDNVTFKEIEVSPPPFYGPLNAQKIVVQGEEMTGNYRSWVRRNAQRMGINGFVYKAGSDSTEILAGHTDKQLLEEFITLCEEGPEETEVSVVEVSPWNKSVNAGFSIKKDSVSQINQKLKNETKARRATDKKYKKIKQENRHFEEKDEEQTLKIGYLQSQIEEVRKELMNVKHQSEKMQNNYSIQQEKLNQLKQKNEVLNKEYNKITNSRSWKITLPLRKIKPSKNDKK